MEEASDHQRARDCFKDRASLFCHVHGTLGLVFLHLPAGQLRQDHPTIRGKAGRESVRNYFIFL